MISLLFAGALIIMSCLAAHGEEAHDGDHLLENKPFKRGPWTPEEDKILVAYVKKHGEGNWNAVQKYSGLERCGKSCRFRWLNNLKPDLKKGPITQEEQSKIIELHANLGNKWSIMASQLPGRTDNEIKNFWNTRRRKLERVGLPLYPPGVKPLTDGNQENLDGSSKQADVSQADKSDTPDVKVKEHKLRQKHPSCTSPLTITESRTSELQGSDSLIHFPVRQPPKVLDDSNMLHNSLDSTCTSSTTPPLILDHDSNEFQLGNCFSGGYASLSGTSSISGAMVSDDIPVIPCVETQQGSSSCWGKHAPPLPSYNESSDTLIQCPPPPEQTQSEPPVSPRSNGFLESILFSSKILEDSDASCLPSLEKGEPNPLEKENSNQRDPTNPDALPDFGCLDNDTPNDKDESDIDGTLFAILLQGCRRRYQYQ